jgi:geranylgeranyl pyrophosphate synthase
MDLVKIFIEEMRNIHLGVGWDIWWHNKYENIPSEENYFQMIESKTSVLFRIGVRMFCRMFQIESKETEILIEFVNNLGKGFQIRDDLINLISEEYSLGKGGIGEDITEGKLSLMALHHIQHSEDGGKALIDILKLKTEDTSLIAEAIRLMEESGSMDYARVKSEEFMEDSWKCAQLALGDGCEKKDELKLILDYIVERLV